MAYQQQGGLANGPGGSGEHHGPQGTEYTLQGEPEKQSTRGQCLSDGCRCAWRVRTDLRYPHRRDAIPPNRMAQP